MASQHTYLKQETSERARITRGSILATEDKKRAERALIESARGRGAFIPSGELSPFESPDWLIRDATLGIEVSWFLRPRRKNLFSGSQLSSFQAEVVEEARTLYFSAANPDADVLVFFENEWDRKREVKSYAAALVEFVRRNLPVDRDCITLNSRHEDDWVEGVSVIRISRTGTNWQAGGVATGYRAEYGDVAERIAAKNKLLPGYRRRLPDWQIWLLMATELRVLQSVEIPSEIAEWKFEFDFNRVLIVPWNGGLIELARK